MEELLNILQIRFDQHRERHPSIKWADVEGKLKNNSAKLHSLWKMERTGGEPDVVEFRDEPGKIIFIDCSPESPIGRRSLCYDRKARISRRKNPPEGSALELAAEIGIGILTEEQYRYLQTLGAFDLKTSSWVKTPEKIRQLGGALLCDRRYDTVFVYHNGADSYYSSRGFRGLLKI